MRGSVTVTVTAVAGAASAPTARTILFVNRIFAELATGSNASDHLMIDATQLKAHRTAASLLKKRLYTDISAAAVAV